MKGQGQGQGYVWGKVEGEGSGDSLGRFRFEIWKNSGVGQGQAQIEGFTRRTAQKNSYLPQRRPAEGHLQPEAQRHYAWWCFRKRPTY